MLYLDNIFVVKATIIQVLLVCTFQTSPKKHLELVGWKVFVKNALTRVDSTVWDSSARITAGNLHERVARNQDHRLAGGEIHCINYYKKGKVQC